MLLVVIVLCLAVMNIFKIYKSMRPTPAYITKSRYKLGLECPTKLFYTSKGDYVNTMAEDDFLMALAEQFLIILFT